MSDNVHVLGAEPNPDVVEALEKLLECARSGEMVSIAFVGHLRDRAVRFGFIRAPGMRQTEMIGAISFLGYKANVDIDQGS